MKDRMNDAIPWLVRNPHSTWTTVGAGRDERPLSGRDPEELTETFRIAANLAVVSMHDPYAEGAPARNFTAGFSAQAGVTAALTALAGLEGLARGDRGGVRPLRGAAAGRIRQPVRDARRGVGDRGTLLQTVPVLPVPTRRSTRSARRSTGGRETAASDRATGRRSTRPTWRRSRSGRSPTRPTCLTPSPRR